jgi:hypothetical protein
VGGAALRVFRSDGRVREGNFTLQIVEGVAGEVIANQLNQEPRTELDRIERLVQMKVCTQTCMQLPTRSLLCCTECYYTTMLTAVHGR